MTDGENLWDDLFHGCAWAAYIEQMAAEGRWPPDAEATKQRAFRYYEEELAKKNRMKENSTRREASPAVRSEEYALTLD